AVAVLFAREGADVAIVYLNEHDDAQATLKHVQAEGRRALAIAGDIRDERFCQDAVAQTIAAFGRLDIVVNNAAFQAHADTVMELSEQRFRDTVATNLFGSFHMTKAALPHLRRGASIINTGSVTGLRGSKHLLDYSSTKGAIHALTKSLAANLLDQGIRVNAIAPGPVWTPLNPADASAEDIAHFGASTDIGRPAQPEELSPAFVFLAAPCCASYITGIVLPITGSVGE
ncbi:MAG: SDR family oxidoreductase, partial [Pseudomonadota bacterium]